ncbi:MAG TPA: hypothetical protein VGM12_14155 [Trebonia sp.]
MLGVNPVQHLLSRYGALSSLTPANRSLLTGREFFPGLISGPFHDGLVLVFAVSAALGLIAAVVSLMRGGGTPPAEPDVPAATLVSSQISPQKESALCPQIPSASHCAAGAPASTLSSGPALTCRHRRTSA